MSPDSNKPAPLIQLDPKFVLLLRLIWLAITLPFKVIAFLYRLVVRIIRRFRSQSEPSSTSSDTTSESEFPHTTANSPKNLTDARAFLSYGGVLWVSELTPQALKKEILESYKEDEVVTIKYLLNKEEKAFDFTVTGAHSKDEVLFLGEILSELFENMKVSQSALRSILISESLGKFLDANGVPDRSVPGFSIDAEGSLLIARYVIQDRRLATLFFEKIVTDDINYQTIRTKARDTLWNQSTTIGERMKLSNFFSPPDSRKRFGSFHGHHIIDLDTPVTDGIYLGLPAREAIWVDSSSPQLEITFQKFLAKVRRLKEALGARLEEKILPLVIEVTRQTIPRDTEQALKLLRESLRLSPDTEVSIETFLAHETGEADHQALLAAYLLERLQKEIGQYLSGKISVDRNWLPGGGHTWVRYSTSSGDIYIIDPKRNFYRQLDDYSTERWPYERANDLPRPRRARPIQ